MTTTASIQHPLRRDTDTRCPNQSSAEVIPDDWVRSTFGEVAELLTGYPFSSKHYSVSGVRLLGGSNVKRDVLDWADYITLYWPSVAPSIDSYELQKRSL